MSVIEELRKTPKGQLKYDRQGLNMQSIEAVVDELHSEMESMQVHLPSPTAFSPRPSFGLRCDADPDTPLVVRTVRVTCPAGPQAQHSHPARQSLQVTVRNRAVRPTPPPGAGRQEESPPLVRVTVDTATDGCRRVELTSRSRHAPPSSTPVIENRPIPPEFSAKTRQSGTRPVFPSEDKLTTSPASRTIDLVARQGRWRDGVAIDRVIPLGARSEQSGEMYRTEDGGKTASVFTSTPLGGETAALTPRTHDKLIHEERQRHHAEAKEQARSRLAAAESALQQLRLQHQLKLQQLAAEQRLRGQEERERRGAQRQQCEHQLQLTTERIEEDRQRRAKDLSDQVQATLERQQAAEQQLRQRSASQRRLLDLMLATQKQIRTVVATVVTNIKECRDRPQLQASPAAAAVEELKKLMTRMDGLVTAAPAEARVSEAEALAVEAARVAEQVTQHINSINMAVATAVSTADQQPAAAVASTPAAAVASTPAAAVASSAAAAVVQLSASTAAVSAAGPEAPASATGLTATLEEAQQRHQSLLTKLTHYRATFTDILSEPKWKQFKFDCQKAVNTPINAISAVSAAHLKDKLEKLRSLLRGHSVSVPGQQQVTAVAHPRGVHFCLDLVAKKFVRQGEDVVSSKPEAAFPLAAVLLELQREFPDLVDLTTAHLLTTCPYLTPLYPALVDGQSNEQYYRKLGYGYTDGVVERQDKFLKRMSGVARLHAALLTCRPAQASPAPGPGSAAPPGLSDAWRWLSAMSNLEPRADITASLLLDFVEVTGAALADAYGTQFFKLITLLHSKYLSVLKQVTPAGCGGPVVRLEQKLQHVVSTGRVPPPPGQLKLYGW